MGMSAAKTALAEVRRRTAEREVGTVLVGRGTEIPVPNRERMQMEGLAALTRNW